MTPFPSEHSIFRSAIEKPKNTNTITTDTVKRRRAHIHDFKLFVRYKNYLTPNLKYVP
jgi:hypothetical protein